jgi:hypothetical protein
MGEPISPGRSQRPGIGPEFIKKVEDELSRRLGQQVSLVLGGGIIAVRKESGPAGKPAAVMSVGPLLRRGRAVEWADAVEQKLNRLCIRTEDVEHLFAEIQKSPNPEKTGAIVLEHAGDYDGEFFEALAQVIARDEAGGHPGRAHKLESLREYLRAVARRRARDGGTAGMWRELAQGAAQERDRDLAQRLGPTA